MIKIFLVCTKYLHDNLDLLLLSYNVLILYCSLKAVQFILGNFSIVDIQIYGNSQIAGHAESKY